jgi:hypothetical protein
MQNFVNAANNVNSVNKVPQKPCHFTGSFEMTLLTRLAFLIKLAFLSSYA